MRAVTAGLSVLTCKLRQHVSIKIRGYHTKTSWNSVACVHASEWPDSAKLDFSEGLIIIVTLHSSITNILTYYSRSYYPSYYPAQFHFYWQTQYSSCSFFAVITPDYSRKIPNQTDATPLLKSGVVSHLIRVVEKRKIKRKKAGCSGDTDFS